MMILCDIGNSTYHFLHNTKEFKLNINDDIPSLNSNDNIYYISVNKDAKDKLLHKYPSAIDIKDYFQFETKYLKQNKQNISKGK